MSPETAQAVVNFIFASSLTSEKIDIGFFGGEPLLRPDFIRYVAGLVEGHPSFDATRVRMAVVTNGTIFSDDIAALLTEHNIAFCLSCDGPPPVQDAFRRFADGRGSSPFVERTLQRAVNTLPAVLVNAVYHPQTFRHLPAVVDYFSGIGLRQIYLNPDFSAPWSREEAELLPEVYGAVAERYIRYHLEARPHYISFIDSKIAVILRDGYGPLERCSMGRGEFAFAASGNIYPCERLIGADDSHVHRLGNVADGLTPGQACGRTPSTGTTNTECGSCSLSSYCMNWCGCSNYFQSGRYDRVGPFLCASERTAIAVSFKALQTLEQRMGNCFFEHLAGEPALSSMLR